MKLFRNIPIQRKITLVILLTCLASLLVAGGALFAFQLVNFKQSFTRSLSTLGIIMANQSAGTVAFKDKSAAEQMLASLRAKSYLEHACIVFPDGSMFAEFGRNGFETPSKLSGSGVPMGVDRDGPYMIFRQEIVLDNETLGILVLHADYGREFNSLLKVYIFTSLIILVSSILLAYLLSARFQRFITMPMLNLFQTARSVAEDKNYSVRARKFEEDEIGKFTDAFNQMLQQISEQDKALRAAHQKKFESLVNSIDGIVWEADPEELHFTFVSQQAERLLGFPVNNWLENPDFFEAHIHDADRKTIVDSLRQSATNKKAFAQEFRMVSSDGTEAWVHNNVTVISEKGRPVLLRGVMFDITERKEAEQQLEELHRQLVEASRQAGMAEVATGVLHNVGNVLNSINISASLLNDWLQHSKSVGMRKISELMTEHKEDMAEFLTESPKGQALPGYLANLANILEQERSQSLEELTSLNRNVQHIKDIVAMQQSYAKVSGVVEFLEAEHLVEDAVQINEGRFNRAGIEIVRNYTPVAPVAVDKHKVLQILVNFLRNAKHALEDRDEGSKKVWLTIAPSENNQIRISIRDNGVGIELENLDRIFNHGFTTKKDGHGFGLHSGALAAKEMGGNIQVKSDGPGHGAEFILELPIAEDSANMLKAS